MGKIAAKQGDKIMATDTHIIMMPTPGGTVPTPTPMPFVGTIMSGCSTDVFIEGKPAATVDSVALNQPVHIPTGGPFQKPPTNQGKILVGSTGVFINGKPAARQGDTAITCNDPTDLPNGQVLAVGTVFIGETGAGAPKPSVQTSKEQKLVKAKIGQPGTLIDGKWSNDKVKGNDEVKLTVNVKGFEDGTPANFLIWDRKGSTERIVAQIDGTVKGDKAEITWKPSEVTGEEQLKEQIEEYEEQPEYYFVVDVEGEEKKSQALKITHSIAIYLEDDKQKPLDKVNYIVKFSDGTEKKGKMKDGYAKIDNAPYGKFTMKVDGYNFTFETGIIKQEKQKAKCMPTFKAGVGIVGTATVFKGIVKRQAFFELAIPIDPEIEYSEDDVLILESENKEYKVTRPLLEGFDGGDGFLSFRFTDLIADLDYSASVISHNKMSTILSKAKITQYIEGEAVERMKIKPMFR